jgi:hypothetical protein
LLKYIYIIIVNQDFKDQHLSCSYEK